MMALCVVFVKGLETTLLDLAGEGMGWKLFGGYVGSLGGVKGSWMSR